MRTANIKILALLFYCAFFLNCFIPSVSIAETGDSGRAVLGSRCGGCHMEQSGSHERISAVRKTPEGWLMTIHRMQHLHGVTFAESELEMLIRYLSDTQGLAPSESAPNRFALERRPNGSDVSLPGELQTMCARCHSGARVALQRRDADEWLKLVHWHVAQHPTIEYQAGARDRLWWTIASTDVPQLLGKLFPLQSEAWDDWSSRAPADLGGSWLVQGRVPGVGQYWGTAEIRKIADAEYEAIYSLENEAGESYEGTSKSIVYTGYEWRGTAQVGDKDIREVFALSDDGQMLAGRWFLAEHREDGGEWSATRIGSQPQIVAVSPVSARTGSTSRITVFGSALNGVVHFGDGTESKVVSQSPTKIVVDVTVDSAAKRGYRVVTIGEMTRANAFAVYDRVDRLRVTPGFGLARIGGGKLEPVTAQFEAVAYMDVSTVDGSLEPVSLGTLPVTWTVAPFNEDAKMAEDVKYAGTIDSTGRFTPGPGGPNPERRMRASNTGNLSVVATLSDPAQPVVGTGRLIVTVQRWNSPPLY